MAVPFENVPEEWTRGCQNYLMNFHLLTILTGQGHISEVSISSETSKSCDNIFFKVIPLEAQGFRHCVPKTKLILTESESEAVKGCYFL